MSLALTRFLPRWVFIHILEMDRCLIHTIKSSLHLPPKQKRSGYARRAEMEARCRALQAELGTESAEEQRETEGVLRVRA